MSALLDHIVAAAVATEENTPDPDQVTPGVVGFIATFFVAAVTVLLVIDMVRRVRRVTYRAQVREQLEAEARDAAAAEAGAAGSAVEGRVDRQQQDRGPVAEERDDR
ncbi:hypothetical protein [Herbiconiux sp.]|uniref:hypothetical protein n=1 Tax=Herbiconiux sp. TaxID=1871186 RepID=UPI0025C499CB|nr:hypothetical protein [Herbiconiux sp.]